MPKRKPPDPNEKPQRERFIETAREFGADESGRKFDRAIRKLIPERRAKPRPPDDA